MSITALKAWSLGAGAVVVAHLVWLFTMWTERYSELAVLVLWVAPFVAALVSSYFSPRNKFVLGISMAFIASALVLITNYAYQLLGQQVDFPGVRGGSIIFLSTSLFNGIICGLGAVAGIGLARVLGRAK